MSLNQRAMHICEEAPNSPKLLSKVVFGTYNSNIFLRIQSHYHLQTSYFVVTSTIQTSRSTPSPFMGGMQSNPAARSMLCCRREGSIVVLISGEQCLPLAQWPGSTPTKKKGLKSPEKHRSLKPSNRTQISRGSKWHGTPQHLVY